MLLYIICNSQGECQHDGGRNTHNKTVVLQTIVNYSIDDVHSPSNLVMSIVSKPLRDSDGHGLRGEVIFINTVLYVKIEMRIFGLWNI